jgi:adenylate cyclase class 2
MAEGNIERELKFPCDDLEGLKEKLRGLQAERVAPRAFEDNVVFDRDGELEAKGSILRLRTDRYGARLTFKGPVAMEGAMRVRVERETRAEDPEALRAILESVGFQAVTRYQKHREEWRLGAVVVALDHTPLGDFVEMEGEGAETVAKRCGLLLDNAERRSYLRLYRDYREEHPEAPADMVFP